MIRILNLRNMFLTAALTGAMAFVSISTATACEPYVWKTVTVYVTVEQPCVHYVTKYDHCGKPYTVKVVTYKTVKIPVQKRVKVYG